MLKDLNERRLRNPTDECRQSELEEAETESNREKDPSSSNTFEKLTLKHPCAGQTGSVCNSLSTKTHSVYLGQQEEGPREEKSQHRPSFASQHYTPLCTVLSVHHFQ